MHGGEIYKNSVLITPAVMKVLESLKKFGPLHMPANLSGIKAFKILPKNTAGAVLTLLFMHRPEEAYLYAFTYEMYSDLKCVDMQNKS